jgi:hypothetical protein
MKTQNFRTAKVPIIKSLHTDIRSATFSIEANFFFPRHRKAFYRDPESFKWNHRGVSDEKDETAGPFSPGTEKPQIPPANRYRDSIDRRKFQKKREAGKQGERG